MFDKLRNKADNGNINDNRKHSNHDNLPPILGNGVPVTHNANASWQEENGHIFDHKLTRIIDLAESDESKLKG